MIAQRESRQRPLVSPCLTSPCSGSLRPPTTGTKGHSDHAIDLQTYTALL